MRSIAGELLVRCVGVYCWSGLVDICLMEGVVEGEKVAVCSAGG